MPPEKGFRSDKLGSGGSWEVKNNDINTSVITAVCAIEQGEEG